MIGVYDSGLGGLLSLNKIVKDNPNEKIIYLGDVNNAPYGNKTKEEIISLVESNINFFINEGVNDLIFACNTICSNIDFNKNYNLKLHDIIKGTVEQINVDKKSNILVFATNLAIKSGRYQSELKNKGYFNVETIILSDLVRMIEGYEDISNIKEYLYQEFKNVNNKPDIIILGCTHFPIVKDIFAKYFNCEIIDSRNISFDINKQNDGPELIIKMPKDKLLKQFLDKYLEVPYRFYE